MRKISIAILTVCMAVFVGCFFACKNESEAFFENVSELRSDILEGESKNFKLRAYCGFKEDPVSADGAVGNKIHYLKFRLIDAAYVASDYFLRFVLQDKEYNVAFNLNPVTDFFTAETEVSPFADKSLQVTIVRGSDIETLTLTSIVPQDVLTPKAVIDRLYSKNKEIFDAYKDEQGNFNAEIRLRIIVKEQKPYYYVGITGADGKLKAFLSDAYSADILAVREVF